MIPRTVGNEAFAEGYAKKGLLKLVTKFQTRMFDMDSLCGKKVPGTKYQFATLVFDAEIAQEHIIPECYLGGRHYTCMRCASLSLQGLKVLCE